MALLGSAALAMWWNMAPEMRAEFEHWHSHEHFAERLAIPGFLRASRFADLAGGEGCFVLYDLADHAVFTSPAYRERLDNPTPWSLRLMPHHRDMVRSQCRVLESVGGASGCYLATLRLSPGPGQAARLRAALGGTLRQLSTLPGLAGGHLLQTDTPAAAETTEQRLRGGKDGAADWILLLSAYDEAALESGTAGPLGPAALRDAGAEAGMPRQLFRLRHTALKAELDSPIPAIAS
jgi:hypothetical protein